MKSVGTEGDGTPDFIDDTYSDNEALTDQAENFKTLVVVDGVGNNGLEYDAEETTADNYAEVNGLARNGFAFQLADYRYKYLNEGTSLFGTRIITSLENER